MGEGQRARFCNRTEKKEIRKGGGRYQCLNGKRAGAGVLPGKRLKEHFRGVSTNERCRFWTSNGEWKT